MQILLHTQPLGKSRTSGLCCVIWGRRRKQWQLPDFKSEIALNVLIVISDYFKKLRPNCFPTRFKFLPNIKTYNTVSQWKKKTAFHAFESETSSIDQTEGDKQTVFCLLELLHFEMTPLWHTIIWVGLMVGPEGEWEWVWRLIFRRPVTHKKSGNVQDIAAALKKNASKDV